jgi:hypothetical protein
MNARKKRRMEDLLLSYIGFVAERNSFGPGDNFEYLLWDELHGLTTDAQQTGSRHPLCSRGVKPTVPRTYQCGE